MNVHHRLSEAALRNLHVDGQAEGDPPRAFTSRILAFNERGLLIGSPIHHGRPVELAPTQRVVCTCRLGREIFRFCTEVTSLGRHKLKPGLLVDVVVLACPAELTLVQRRKNYRVSLVGRNPLDVTLWPVEVNCDGEASVVGEYHGKIADISAGGIGVLLKEQDFHEQSRGRQVWARFMLPGEQDSLIFRMQVRRWECVESSGLWTVGLEILEFIEPGEHEGMIDRLARFVVAQEREQLNRRKDR